MIYLIAGLSGSGKTTFAGKLKDQLHGDATILSMDSFYHGKNQLYRISGWHNNPRYCDMERLMDAVQRLADGEEATIPRYSMTAQDRVGEDRVRPQSNLIVEGLWTLTYSRLRNIGDVKYYLECPYEERLERKMMRDMSRGWSGPEILSMAPRIEELGKQFVEPFEHYADFVVNTSRHHDANTE